MELQKKSELTASGVSYAVDTRLASDDPPLIETRITTSVGNVVYRTAQDISDLKPIFQNSQKVFERLEHQHEAVASELREGRLPEVAVAAAAASPPDESSGPSDPETDALEHAIQLLGQGTYERATSTLRAVLETYPNCVEAREFLEIAYKAGSDARLPVDLLPALKRGTEAFSDGRQRDAIESWKQCLLEEPANRALQTLVLLATTWSQPRRELYAERVLAADGTLLSGARPEEAEALVLVAQSVYAGGSGNGSGNTPAKSPTAAGQTQAQPQPQSPPLPAATSVDVPKPSPSPSPTPTPPPLPPPPPSATPSPAPAPAPRAQAEGARPSEPSVDTQPVTRDVAPGQKTPASAPAASEPGGGAAVRPGTGAVARPQARRPMPAGRARQSSPWPLVGGVVGVVVVSVVLAFWLLSGGGTVPPAELERAATLAGSGQYAQAIAAYDGILQQFGDHAEIYLGRGRARLASGNADAGLADLERAYAIDPSAHDIAEEIGDVQYSQGDYPGAIEAYEKAFASGGGDAEARYRLAVSLVQQARGEDALGHLTAAIQSDPTHGEAQFLLAQLANRYGRYEEAERALRAAEAHVEAGSDFLAQLGVALLEQGKLDEAEESAREFIRAYPNDARARALLGEVYLSRQQYEPARAQLIQALRTDPREPRAQIALGRTWLAIGKSRNDAQDLAKARQVLESATGVHEGRRLLALGQVALAGGDPASAQQLLERALTEDAPELPVHLSMAEAKAVNDDLTGAAEALQRASGLSAENPAIAMSLAVVYSQLQEPVRACEQFLKTLQTIGLLAPPGPDSGPVVLPLPLVPLPDRFNVTRAIRSAYETTLQQMENDPTATELKTLAENATFVLEG